MGYGGWDGKWDLWDLRDGDNGEKTNVRSVIRIWWWWGRGLGMGFGSDYGEDAFWVEWECTILAVYDTDQDPLL